MGCVEKVQKTPFVTREAMDMVDSLWEEKCLWAVEGDRGKSRPMKQGDGGGTMVNVKRTQKEVQYLLKPVEAGKRVNPDVSSAFNGYNTKEIKFEGSRLYWSGGPIGVLILPSTIFVSFLLQWRSIGGGGTYDPFEKVKFPLTLTANNAADDESAKKNSPLSGGAVCFLPQILHFITRRHLDRHLDQFISFHSYIAFRITDRQR
ncbi:hypothetical protein LXL04_025880 [Taraxacum kok-saghyz]